MAFFFSKAGCPKKIFERCKRSLTKPPPNKLYYKEKLVIKFEKIPDIALLTDIMFSCGLLVTQRGEDQSSRPAIRMHAALAVMGNLQGFQATRFYVLIAMQNSGVIRPSAWVSNSLQNYATLALSHSGNL